jgi:hypothetical protein
VKRREKNRQRRNRKRRGRSKKSPGSSNPRGPTPRRFGLQIVDLEIAKGHDGLLRGAPEPVVVMGAFLIADGKCVLCGRGVFRFDSPKKIPDVITKKEGKAHGLIPKKHDARLAFVFAALEEDGGGAIQEVYARLERGAHVVAIDREDHSLRALHLEEWPAPAPGTFAGPSAVDLQVDGEDLQKLSGDDWVAASLLIVPMPFSLSDPIRIHFRDGEGKNDWTLRIKAKA